jgi:O-acetylhomoserine/O-acetylserine sulfhydrylase-like pyridoxal-dependent enzyme
MSIEDTKRQQKALVDKLKLLEMLIQAARLHVGFPVSTILEESSGNHISSAIGCVQDAIDLAVQIEDDFHAFINAPTINNSEALHKEKST